MWHCPQVVGSRATSTEAVWRVWQAVQVPIVPSALGRPTLWQLTQPLLVAEAPSRAVSGWAGRSGRAGMELLAEGDLLRRQVFVTVDGGPGRRGVTAAQELLVDRFVAGSAVGGRHAVGDDEAVMVVAFLTAGRLMALQAVDLLACMNAQLVLVDDRVLQVGVAFGAFAGGAHQFGGGLFGHDARPIPVNRVSGHQQGGADDQGDEHGSESHGILPR